MINIVCKITKDDLYCVQEKSLNLISEDPNIIQHTFFDTIKKAKLSGIVNDEALDLYYIALFVFCSDRLIKREHFEDSWTRKIKLYIPVLKYEKWELLKEELTNMISYLSGDIWEIEFRHREKSKNEIKVEKKIKKNITELDINCISMFSGGLDSYIGIIDLLEQDQKPLLISHYGGGKGVREYQKMLKENLIENYKLMDDNFFEFYSKAVNGVENTTRTRSFMFFAHAIAIASTFNKPIKLYIPENGLISLNIPIVPSRNGSSSTRTTHPYYMKELQKILKKLELEIIILNPYQFKTKGEMIKESLNLDLLTKTIQNTMSCSHPDNGRYRKERVTSHCGTCIPCTIRRAAIKYSEVCDKSNYYDKHYSNGDESKNNLKAYKLGINKFNKKHIHIFDIQRSGPISENIDEYISLYERGMLEIENFIKDFNND